MCKCAACPLCADSPATKQLRAAARQALAPPKTSQPQPQPQPAAPKSQPAARPSSSAAAPTGAEPTHQKKGGTDMARKEHEAKGVPGAVGGSGSGGGKGKGVGIPVVWQPGQCADWCSTSSADDCELGGCVACTWCTASRAAVGSGTAAGAAGGGAKPAGSPAVASAAPAGMGTGAPPKPPKQVLSHPMLMPFPLWRGGKGRGTALGALCATLVGLGVFALLALVSLRRHARPLYGSLLEQLPPKLASRVDLVASLGRGGGGYRAAVPGDDGDDDGAHAAEASWEPPPLGGGGWCPSAPDASAAEVRFAAATTAARP